MKNHRKNNSKKVIQIITVIEKIVATGKKENLFDLFIDLVSNLIGDINCSIYLDSEIFNYYNGNSGTFFAENENNANVLSHHELILTSTNHHEFKNKINVLKFSINNSVIGQIYKNRTILQTPLTQNQIQLNFLPSKLSTNFLFDINANAQIYMQKSLICPLYTPERNFGVIQYFPINFELYDTDFLDITRDINDYIISVLFKSFEENEFTKSIIELISNRSTNKFTDLFIETTKYVKQLLNCDNSQVYFMTDNKNKHISLVAENGKKTEQNINISRNTGPIGWVYKTGKPLYIKNSEIFTNDFHLSDETLIELSGDMFVNESSRTIYKDNNQIIRSKLYPASILAIPIKQDEEIIGVLSAQAFYGSSCNRANYFAKSELKLLNHFSEIITNYIEKSQEKVLSNLLVSLGNNSDPKKLFSLVIENIPKLVSSAGCSIFEFKKYSQTSQYPHLILATTSRNGLNDNDNQRLIYKIGEGKTGFCGLSRASIVINHYGYGDVSEKKMDKEIFRVKNSFPKDVIGRLKDKNGFQVGIIQLRRCKTYTDDINNKFSSLCNHQVISNFGLPSNKLENFYSEQLEPSWSFVAIPIISSTDLFGVITISRPVPENPFSPNDITVVESIAGRLASVLSNIQMQEQRETLLLSLAHEISTPLTGILADSENLSIEISESNELKNIAKNTLGQVQRLQLLTETIMGVFSRNLSYQMFEMENIGDILINASSLFSAEAAHKKCDILEPRSVDGQFPNIEMQVFDLLIALKNIIHNAVKYSFSPSNDKEKKYVKIWGSHTDSSRMFYRINIQNFGVGISQNEIDNRSIFEPYYRGITANDRRRTGAGFGLAYARKIIEDSHKGRISVSCLHQYNEAFLTTFSITLPVKQEYAKFLPGERR